MTLSTRFSFATPSKNIFEVCVEMKCAPNSSFWIDTSMNLACKESFTRRGFLTACLKASNMRRAKFECGRWRAEHRKLHLECKNCLGQFGCYKHSYHLRPGYNWHSLSLEASQPGNENSLCNVQLRWSAGGSNPLNHFTSPRKTINPSVHFLWSSWVWNIHLTYGNLT